MPDERAPQQERSLARRAAILDSAASVFDRVGYGTASLSQIANDARVGQGLIYFYFRTKEAIALAVIEEQNARTFAVMREHADTESPLSMLVRASRGIGQLLLDDAIVRAGIRLSLEQGIFADPTSDFYDQWIQGVIDAFAAADAAGELDTALSPERLGANVVATFTGVQLVSNVRTERRDLMSSLETMWTVLVHGLAAASSQDRLNAVVRETFSTASGIHDPVAKDAVT
ncbi:ScbR family autoregulator-binding transcription factor [Curtobacterium sp. MCBA15_004]|uniref:ScbR family autoregulator-binding transcription factor n=1 Tax=Curtobacterium sp. MCBA15_004 TaxID=1898733 RepID=UPI0008DE553A|nr:ScbR family autoregulator-binding transcription factor [Curtobacterium sp. MCBA15_004]WIA97011.1 ScbR family autoregulator-binding transcription factor [Curtobacterium sp. MCBA15_004]